MLLYNDFRSVKARAVLETFSEKSGITDSCAFPCGDTLTFTLRVPRVFCATGAVMALYSDSDMSDRDIAAKNVEPCDELRSDEVGYFPAYDSFSVRIDTKSLGEGLFYHTFESTPYMVGCGCRPTEASLTTGQPLQELSLQSMPRISTLLTASRAA